MKKIFLTVLSVLFFNVFCFAQIKIFTKQGESVVQKDQSVNQVISYLKQKLTREAQEQAGTFITTNLKIENYQITKDEFKSFAGSISKITVLEEKPFMKKEDQHVKVKIKVEIDTDNVKAYLEKIMQDNEYKEQAQKAIKEAEKLKKENLELEKKLKTATKQEYEQKLSLQAQQLVQTQKQREIELNKMAVEAKEEFAKIKEEHHQQQIKRDTEILKLKQKIAQEKDNIKKAELENQAKIKELELKAKENQKSWKTNTGKPSIQQAIQEATKLKQETAEIINRFETLLKENEEKTLKSYNEQIQFSCNNKEKDKWETEEEYNARLQKNKQITEKLEREKEETVFKNKIKTIKSMLTTLKPFIKKLQYFQTKKFYDGNNSKAEFIGIEDVNSDKLYFVMNIKYSDITYELNYNFSDLGREKAKLMCSTVNQFVIEPLFSVNNELEQELVEFNVKHLGTKTERNIGISATIKQFDEINLFDIYKQKYEFQQTISKIILELSKSKDHRLIKFTKLKDRLKKEMIDLMIDFSFTPAPDQINYLKYNFLNKLPVAVSAGKAHIVVLQKDGTVVAVGDNRDGECDVENWKDIIAISAGGSHTVGLKKDGTVVAVGLNKYHGQCNVNNWKDIVAVSAGFIHTVGLKKDGTVVAVGSNDYGQCNVKNWKNIVAVSAGGRHTVGLKKGGTVVAVGSNDYGQCNVKDWKNIVAVSAGYRHTVGLKKDGTVVAVGRNEDGQCNVGNWENIVAISGSTVGLKKDGTVVITTTTDKEDYIRFN